MIKATPVNIICDYMAFRCNFCDTTQVVKQSNGTYTPPNKCQSCKKPGATEAAYNSPLSKTIDWQSVVLQESECDMAKIPQTLECELTEDLVKSCLPGDEITISGVIKVI